MKWFKHDTNARNDLRLKLLKKKFGLEGYGVYFNVLEIIGEFVEKDNLDEWGYVDKLHTTETLAEEIGIDAVKLDEIFAYCNELGLFTQKNKRLYCDKILTRLDEYADKIRKTNDNVGTKSGETPKKVPLEEEEEEEQNKNKKKNIGITLPQQKNYSSIKDITLTDLEEIANKYQVSLGFVKLQFEKLTNWTQAKGKTYKNYKQALMNWVLSDVQKQVERRANGTSKVSINTSEL